MLTMSYECSLQAFLIAAGCKGGGMNKDVIRKSSYWSHTHIHTHNPPPLSSCPPKHTQKKPKTSRKIEKSLEVEI